MDQVKKITEFLAVLLLSIGFTACSGGSGNEMNNTAIKDSCAKEENTVVILSREQAERIGITTGKAEYRGLHNTLNVNGKLDVPPQNLVSVSAPLSGFLTSTAMLEGLHVHKGDVLAVLEHPEIAQLQESFIEAKNKYDFLQEELKRQKELNQEQAGSVKVLQQTQSDFNIAQARFKSLEERMRMAGINKNKVLNGTINGSINIISPINGYVTRVNVNIGKMVNQQDVLFEIVDTEHLHAELTVFEKDITRIKEGQKVRFNLANDPDKELTATVHLIGRAFDETRSVRIHCHLDKEDKELLPGMFINATIELNEQEVSCVPVSALVRENEKQYIFIQEGEEKTCNKHHLCTEHTYCPPEEDCPEHPDCEAHEKCAKESKCTHTNCREHERCTDKTLTAAYRFKPIEVKTGVSDGNYIEIKALNPLEEDAQIVVKGAFFILSQLKMSGSLDACCQ